MIVDLILHNGRIHTQDPSRAVVEDLAVLDGRVVAVGDDVAGLEARERVDLRGRAVFPGFNDAHAHSVWFGMSLTELDLSSARTVDEVYRLVAERAGGMAEGQWLVASGLNHGLLGGEAPDRDVLDRLCGGRPLWIKHASGHSCQLNGVALGFTSIEEHIAVQPDGGRIVPDQDGRPTGVLEEKAMALIRDVLLPYPIDAVTRALDLATAQYAREGLTSASDAGVAAGWISHAPGELAAYQNALESGVLRTRMQVMPTIDALSELRGHGDEPLRLGLPSGVRTGWGDDRLQFGPVKVFVDGSVLGRTAQMREHYENCPGHHGYLQEDAAIMRERVLAAYAAGWSLALHAVGDAALDLALDLIAEATALYGTRRVPNRVEHGTVVRPDQLRRLADLGVACVVQPVFLPVFGEDMRRAIGEERTLWSHRGRSQLEAGLPLAFSSDRPVVAGAPLAGIQAMVERLTEDGRLYGPDERISVDQAIHSATVGSSEVTGQQHRKGRLTPGQLADFVVLEQHPAEVATSEIAAIPVLATAVGGTFTHRVDDL